MVKDGAFVKGPEASLSVYVARSIYLPSIIQNDVSTEANPGVQELA
jgi:hypothetical protein